LSKEGTFLLPLPKGGWEGFRGFFEISKLINSLKVKIRKKCHAELVSASNKIMDL
jgi:hypothetical protein